MNNKKEIEKFLEEYRRADEEGKNRLTTIAASESSKWDSIFKLIMDERGEV